MEWANPASSEGKRCGHLESGRGDLWQFMSSGLFIKCKVFYPAGVKNYHILVERMYESI